MGYLDSLTRISEQASIGTVYHYTSLYATLEVLKKKAFRLTSAVRVGNSETIHGNEAFFLSVTRSKQGGYHARHIGNYGVLMELDYDSLRSRAKVGPVDYYGRAWRLMKQDSNEMEERVFSNKQFLRLPTPASKMIRTIHILMKKDSQTNSPDNVRLRRILIMAKQNGIGIYIYQEARHWLAMREQFALPWTEIKKYITGKEENLYQRMPRKNELAYYYELYIKPKGLGLSKRADKLRYSLTYYPGEALRNLQTDMHNNQKDEYMGKIVPIIQKLGGLESFISFLTNKYQT